MTWDEFLQKRKAKSFAAEDIREILDQLGYHFEWLDTQVTTGHTWKESGLTKSAAQEKIRETTEALKIPYQFTYIKFYKTKGGHGPFALVAGKTNLGNPDFDFNIWERKGEPVAIEEMGKNKARAWLCCNECDWYCRRVLVVWDEKQAREESHRWSPQANWALTVEADICGLFGLFSS